MNRLSKTYGFNRINKRRKNILLISAVLISAFFLGTIIQSKYMFPFQYDESDNTTDDIQCNCNNIDMSDNITISISFNETFKFFVYDNTTGIPVLEKEYDNSNSSIYKVDYIHFTLEDDLITQMSNITQFIENNRETILNATYRDDIFYMVSSSMYFEDTIYGKNLTKTYYNTTDVPIQLSVSYMTNDSGSIDDNTIAVNLDIELNDIDSSDILPYIIQHANKEDINIIVDKIEIYENTSDTTFKMYFSINGDNYINDKFTEIF